MIVRGMIAGVSFLLASAGAGVACEATLDEFMRLSTGMSYADAVAIIGCRGTEISRSEMAGFITVMYMWEGNTLIGNMNAMFQNDKLVSKAQMGLK